MNFTDTLLMIQESGETILSQDTKSMFTATRRFLSVDGDWVQDMNPGTVEKRYTKGGEQFYWKRTEEPNESRTLQEV